MRTERHYLEGTREEKDAEAIKDIKEYLSQEQWDAIMQGAGAVLQKAPGWDFQSINFMFGITGIDGFPVHAFGRRYCLEQYKQWMRSGDDAVPVDDQGFTIGD
jgi:hypothetical protein